VHHSHLARSTNKYSQENRGGTTAAQLLYGAWHVCAMENATCHVRQCLRYQCCMHGTPMLTRLEQAQNTTKLKGRSMHTARG
jgi:hypothetical protein